MYLQVHGIEEKTKKKQRKEGVAHWDEKTWTIEIIIKI
jgi:hypothetical protein